MFTLYYEVHFQAKSNFLDSLCTGVFHFGKISDVIEFLTMSDEYYDFESVEIYRVY